MSDKMVDEVFENTDWALLAQQKRALVELAQTPETEGLLGFIDALQDAAEADGYPVVWTHEMEAHKARMARTFDVTVSVTVTDDEALIYAGTVWLVKHGAVQTMAEARERLSGDDAVEQALRLLIDPGTDIGGVSVQDSTCVEVI